MTDLITPFEDTGELRNEIIRACLFLQEKGFCIGTWGNVSVRVEEGLIVTPSAVDYSTMKPVDLVVVSMAGEIVRGDRLPTSEVQLHRLLLEKRPDVGSIIHFHSPMLTAVAAAHRTIPVCVEDMAQILGADIKCTEYIPGEHHLELAEAAYKTMGTESNGVLLGNHGPVVCGRNLAETVVAAQILEKAATVFIHAEALGGCMSIPPKHAKAERHRFLYKYGKE